MRPVGEAELVEAHEAGIAGFLTPGRAARFATLLGRPRGRVKLRTRLAHHAGDLDPRWATKLSSSVGVRDIEALLQAHGAPDRCYVVSESAETDGRLLALRDTLDASVTVDRPALISCVPGALGLFVDEAPDGQWLLRRPSARGAGPRD